MNEQLPQTGVRTTQFADGLPRRSWTVAEFEKLATTGIFSGSNLEGERLELLGGEIVPMSPKGPRHELVRNELLIFWYRSRTSNVKIISETPVLLNESTQPQPDLIIIPPEVRPSNPKGDEVLLVVEVADTSYAKDTQAKAQLYAAAGVRDYWVIDAMTLATTVLRDPTHTGFQSGIEVAPDQTITPLHAPELALALNELGLEPA